MTSTTSTSSSVIIKSRPKPLMSGKMLPCPEVVITPPPDTESVPERDQKAVLRGDLPFRSSLLGGAWTCPSIQPTSRRCMPPIEGIDIRKIRRSASLAFIPCTEPSTPTQGTFPGPFPPIEDYQQPRTSSSLLKRLAPKLYECREARKLREDPLIARFPVVGKPLWDYRKLSRSHEPVETCPNGKLRKRKNAQRSKQPGTITKLMISSPSPSTDSDDSASGSELDTGKHAPLTSISEDSSELISNSPPSWKANLRSGPPTGRFYSSLNSHPPSLFGAKPLSSAPVHDLRSPPTPKLTPAKLSGSPKDIPDPSPLSLALVTEDTRTWRFASNRDCFTLPPVSRVQYFPVRLRELRQRELEFVLSPNSPGLGQSPGLSLASVSEETRSAGTTGGSDRYEDDQLSPVSPLTPTFPRHDTPFGMHHTRPLSRLGHHSSDVESSDKDEDYQNPTGPLYAHPDAPMQVFLNSNAAESHEHCADCRLERHDSRAAFRAVTDALVASMPLESARDRERVSFERLAGLL